MEDTTSDVETRFASLLAARSGAERILIACEMFDLARALVVSSVATEEPALSPADLRARIFERTYGNDFNPEDRARIIARLRG